MKNAAASGYIPTDLLAQRDTNTNSALVCITFARHVRCRWTKNETVDSSMDEAKVDCQWFIIVYIYFWHSVAHVSGFQIFQLPAAQLLCFSKLMSCLPSFEYWLLLRRAHLLWMPWSNDFVIWYHVFKYISKEHFVLVLMRSTASLLQQGGTQDSLCDELKWRCGEHVGISSHRLQNFARAVYPLFFLGGGGQTHQEWQTSSLEFPKMEKVEEMGF